MKPKNFPGRVKVRREGALERLEKSWSGFDPAKVDVNSSKAKRALAEREALKSRI